ncbi:MAG: GUN4 domain-containing protein [Leptolyngbya sp. Prado105]|jgi:hypothetical protein|nr:GUN4 domain-containing protein [Leptolyngbya sp. Prado105]
MSISIFFSYSHKDEALRDKLAEHLSALKRSNVIQEWHDRQIPPGSEWKDEIDRNLRTADIILLLVSASFLSSDYCWSEELAISMARHEAKEACIIPIILRPCDWQETPFAKLQVLPKDAKAVTLWSNEDEALTNVAQSIRLTVNQVVEQKKQIAAKTQETEPKVETLPVPVMLSTLPKCPAENDLQSEKEMDYVPLRDMLKAEKWQEADAETRRVMFILIYPHWESLAPSAEPCFYNNAFCISPCTDLKTIDRLWVNHSNGRFGFSVQKEIFTEMGFGPGYQDKKFLRKYDPFRKLGNRLGWHIRGDVINYPGRDRGLRDWSLISPLPRGHLPRLGSRQIWDAKLFTDFMYKIQRCGM